MESFTKVKLNDSELKSAVQAAFGEEAVLVSAIELTGGFFNTAYDLELEDGRQLILKVAPLMEPLLSATRRILWLLK